MFFQIGCLAVFCGLAAMNQDASEVDPAVAAGITVVHDIPYRQGPSKQWRLDLAMRKGSLGKLRPAIVVIHGGGWLEGDNPVLPRGNMRFPATSLTSPNSNLSL